MKFVEVQLRSPHMASLHFQILRATKNITKLRLPTPATRCSATASARCPTTAATRCSATQAGASSCRIALCLSALLVTAEGARTDAALTAGCSVASCRLPVSVERRHRWAGTVVNSAARGSTSIVSSASRAPTSVVGVPVIKRGAPGVVPAAAISCVMATPIESPMIPAPSKTSEPTDSEADSKREVRAVKPNSGIRVPSRPRHYGTSINQPRIVRGDVNDLGAGRLNDDRRAFRRYGLLRRGLKIAGFLRLLPHHLNGIHHILFLVVVSVA